MRAGRQQSRPISNQLSRHPATNMCERVQPPECCPPLKMTTTAPSTMPTEIGQFGAVVIVTVAAWSSR
jgi:hypothetical protein